MGVPAIAHFILPARPYDLWLEGRLKEELGIPYDSRTRVEIIGGEIVVSPAPLFHHARILTETQEAFFQGEISKPDFPWRCVQVVDFALPLVGDGYIPDLIVLSAAEYEDRANANLRQLTSQQIAMVVEVTSESTAGYDRQPGRSRSKPRRTKWSGYAHEEVEFYLLVDRAPKAARVTLFTEPDPERGVYVGEQSWAFGETVVLPEPFGVEMPTGEWEPWAK